MQPAGIVLREKDLPAAEYQVLARDVLEVCRQYETPCILHTYTDAALALSCDAVHLPLHILRFLPLQTRAQFRVLGASCHSVADAKEAENLGCTYITAGHVFLTDCKKGLPARGLDFLESVCAAVQIPVWGIGGITPENLSLVQNAGARGGCIMSTLMQCTSPETLLMACR